MKWEFYPISILTRNPCFLLHVCWCMYEKTKKVNIHTETGTPTYFLRRVKQNVLYSHQHSAPFGFVNSIFTLCIPVLFFSFYIHKLSTSEQCWHSAPCHWSLDSICALLCRLLYILSSNSFVDMQLKISEPASVFISVRTDVVNQSYTFIQKPGRWCTVHRGQQLNIISWLVKGR